MRKSPCVLPGLGRRSGKLHVRWRDGHTCTIPAKAQACACGHCSLQRSSTSCFPTCSRSPDSSALAVRRASNHFARLSCITAADMSVALLRLSPVMVMHFNGLPLHASIGRLYANCICRRDGEAPCRLNPMDRKKLPVVRRAVRFPRRAVSHKPPAASSRATVWRRDSTAHLEDGSSWQGRSPAQRLA